MSRIGALLSSLVSVSYAYNVTADVDFGRLQARDMLQHLWTGPISNASVDVVQGSRSVEVRAVGVTKVCFFICMTLYIYSSFPCLLFFFFFHFDKLLYHFRVQQLTVYWER